MKYKVEGTLYYEGVVEFLNEKETLKDFKDCIADYDIKELADHVITNSLNGVSFIDGVGKEGEDFIIHDIDAWNEYSKVTKVEE